MGFTWGVGFGDTMFRSEGLTGVALAFFLVALLLSLTVMVLAVVVTVQAYKAGREGWWVYLIAIFVSPLNLVAVIAWFAHLRHNPIMMDGRPFL